MLDYIKSELKKLNIEYVSCLSLEDCEIVRPYLLEKQNISSGSVVIFAVPYLTRESAGERNISSYAVSKDYHIFFKNLFEDLTAKLKNKYPQYKFAGFSDHSPINEIKAAAKSGIGLIGTNHLLITEKYSSYVFIGEIITDAILPSTPQSISHCIDCKKCVLACPINLDITKCLSEATQKKAPLSSDEISNIKSSGCVWGCDICQEVCPYTIKAKENKTIFTDIEFFKNNQISIVTSDNIENMNEESFSQRAYSWRGKNVILRNIKLIEGEDD
jgi:epoxyqueuosine reductase QueG